MIELPLTGVCTCRHPKGVHDQGKWVCQSFLGGKACDCITFLDSADYERGQEKAAEYRRVHPWKEPDKRKKPAASKNVDTTPPSPLLQNNMSSNPVGQVHEGEKGSASVNVTENKGSDKSNVDKTARSTIPLPKTIATKITGHTKECEDSDLNVCICYRSDNGAIGFHGTGVIYYKCCGHCPAQGEIFTNRLNEGNLPCSATRIHSNPCRVCKDPGVIVTAQPQVISTTPKQKTGLDLWA